MHLRLLKASAALAYAVFLSQPLHAAGSDYAEAMRVRALISLPAPARSGVTPFDTEAERLELPTSRGFHQQGTELCWAYAMLNALETVNRVRHVDSELELSRRAMQYFTIENRHVLRINGEASYLGERGVAVDAMRLLTREGLVAFADFADVDDPYGDFDIRRAVDRARGVEAKLAALHEGLEVVYGFVPPLTHLGDEEVTRAELTTAVVEGTEWQSYAIARDGREGWRTHPDPDARPGVQSYFMPEPAFEARIRAALMAGYPVEITVGGHCILIYGAAYDAAGRATRYLIKDSYPGYFYEADPGETMANLVEMTTARLSLYKSDP